MWLFAVLNAGSHVIKLRLTLWLEASQSFGDGKQQTPILNKWYNMFWYELNLGSQLEGCVREES